MVDSKDMYTVVATHGPITITLPTWASEIEFFCDRLRRRIRENENTAKAFATRDDLAPLERALEVERCEARLAAYRTALDDAEHILLPLARERRTITPG